MTRDSRYFFAVATLSGDLPHNPSERIKELEVQQLVFDGVVDDGDGDGDDNVILAVAHFYSLEGTLSLIHIDLASGFRQISITEKGKHEIVYYNAGGHLHEFNRKGFWPTVLLAAFTRLAKKASAPPLPGVDSWLDGILIASITWE